jgi:UDP-N-acetylglucosamine 1-carboxyvinyltransferase
MDKFIINGGKTLKGEIEVRGAKNAAFPILAATLLTEETCVIDNLPLIEDIYKMIEIIEKMGAKINWVGERKIEINTKDVDVEKLDKGLIKKLRGSVLLVGPLLARFRKLKFAQPGGCIIGARPISTHLDVFKQVGANIIPDEDSFVFDFDGKIKTSKVILNELSVTTTENILLFLSNFSDTVEVKIADCDYQVQELAKVLQKMGAEIEGIGTHNVKIKGVKRLKGFEHFVMYDPIEAGTFILLAAAVKGSVLIKNAPLEFLELPLKKLKDAGLPFDVIDDMTINVKPWSELKLEKVQSLPYPSIGSDILPLFGVLATQANGTTLIHDPLYENRLKYLEELNKMGAQIIFADPHRAIITGPTQLFGIEVNSPDIRGGASLVAGALIARGTTTISNVYQIDRGYEKIEERLQLLGADIKRISE